MNQNVSFGNSSDISNYCEGWYFHFLSACIQWAIELHCFLHTDNNVTFLIALSLPVWFQLNHQGIPLGYKLEACLKAKVTSPLVGTTPCLGLKHPHPSLLLFGTSPFGLGAFMSISNIIIGCHIQVVPQVLLCGRHLAPGVLSIHGGLSYCKLPPSCPHLTAHLLKGIKP